MNKKVFGVLVLVNVSVAMGSSLILPLLPVYAVTMGATGLELGLIFSGFNLSRFLMLLLVGQLGDTWNRKGFILAGLAVYIVVSAAYVWAPGVIHLVICRLLQGVGAAMVIPVARACMADMTPTGEEGRIMGYANMAYFGGLAAGPWLGGFFNDALGIDTAFYAMGVLAVCSLLLVSFQIPNMPGAASNAQKQKSSYPAMFKIPALAAIFLFRFGTIIGIGMNWTFMPVYGQSVLGLSSSMIGIVISLNVIMTTVFQPLFGRMADRVDRVRMTFYGGVLASIILMCLPFCQSFLHLFILNLLIGITVGFYVPPLMAMVVDVGRETGFMTRIMSFLEMGFSFGMIVGPILAGLVQQRLGLHWIFWLGGGFGLCSVLVFAAIFALAGQPVRK